MFQPTPRHMIDVFFDVFFCSLPLVSPMNLKHIVHFPLRQIFRLNNGVRQGLVHLSLATIGALFAVSGAAQVAETLVAPAAAGAKPKVYALVAAVGSQLNVVHLKRGVGSNLDPYTRTSIAVPDQRLNFVVLRAVDRSIAKVDPQSTRVMLQFSEPDLTLFPHNQRHAASATALLAAMKSLPDRSNWDEIVMITPRYARTGSDLMGNKLWGVGVYVQPLASDASTESSDLANLLAAEADTVSSRGEMDSSSTFVAPYAYLSFTVLNAKTLEVVRKVDRLDSRKVNDKDCESVDLFKCFDADQHGAMIERMVERAASRAVTGGNGSVEMPSPKVVPESK